MFPGLTTRLSREAVTATTTISPKSDIVYVSGTTAIATITPPFAGFSGMIVLIPDAAYTLVTTGNIAIASTATAGRAMSMFFDNVQGKWYPSY